MASNSKWGHALRCDGCGCGLWKRRSDGTQWLFQGEPGYMRPRDSERLVCRECGGVAWSQEIGRPISRKFWWNPATWWLRPRWEWKRTEPKADAGNTQVLP